MDAKLKPNAVELHPATDEWMQGDRYGSIQARRHNGEILVRLDKSQKLKWFHKDNIAKEYSR
jgi:hypothetical protein